MSDPRARDPFVAQAARALVQLAPPPRLLLAVSGGADSVALLAALAAAHGRRQLRDLSFVVGHVDHGLRADSPADLALVAAHAERLALPFVSRTVKISARGEGLEAAARRARYAALREMAEETGCEAIVTAHTATDQAETLLWRLARGTGLQGLGAMAPRTLLSGQLVLRPLLSATREETRAFCARAGLRFHDDPTNVDERPRARLRAEVLPVLERLAPGAVRRLAATAGRLREDERLLASLLEREAAGDIGEIARLRQLPGPLRTRALVRWVEEQVGSRRRLMSVHLDALERLVQTGRGEVELPAGRDERLVARAQAGRLLLERRARERGAGPKT